ncbi:MAG: glutamate synthase subunit beta [Clostridia bacterium]|nr:glutamate synthase subunit beta [Clostridia bacterium]
MGKATGFLEVAREENPWRVPEARMSDYDDLCIPQGSEGRYAQASRCMNCGVPFCQSSFGCPLNNLIPEWNDLLFRGQEQAALQRLLKTAPFPEFTGRVCPALCEKACNLADDGVTNRDNELYLIEKGFEKGWIQPRLPKARTGRRVAVVGSGPSGLAAAALRNPMGHAVTVYERADRPGGLLMYGIPNMKLPKHVVTRRIELMRAEGVGFALGAPAEAWLLEAYDAVVMCGGAKRPRALSVENAGAAGVHFAVDYLTAATQGVLSGTEPSVSARGKVVVVVGGGDTGNDCVGTALRQGCSRVTQLEMMSEPPGERMPGNPWPQWPRTLRTDYGQVEAMSRQGSDPRVYETTVRRIFTDGSGKVTAIETVCLKREPNGHFSEVPGTERELSCGLLLIAAGFLGCEQATAEQFDVRLDDRGNMMPPDGSHHLWGNLFSAGDMRTGQSLVVRALADGRSAAREVHRWLKEGTGCSSISL